jgi:hypothetical protein
VIYLQWRKERLKSVFEAKNHAEANENKIRLFHAPVTFGVLTHPSIRNYNESSLRGATTRRLRYFLRYLESADPDAMVLLLAQCGLLKVSCELRQTGRSKS